MIGGIGCQPGDGNRDRTVGTGAVADRRSPIRIGRSIFKIINTGSPVGVDGAVQPGRCFGYGGGISRIDFRKLVPDEYSRSSKAL